MYSSRSSLNSSGMLRTSRYLANLERIDELVGSISYIIVIVYSLESILEPLGDISEGVLIPEDLADQQLLAVNIVVVELFINLLEHGDPLQNVHGIEVIAEVSGPSMQNTNEMICKLLVCTFFACFAKSETVMKVGTMPYNILEPDIVCVGESVYVVCSESDKAGGVRETRVRTCERVA